VPNFVAKLIAGGLSAVVILVWWPAVFPADTVASWLARGVAWTFAFEIFLHAFTPLERALWETHPARRLRDRAARPGGGLPLGRSATLACSALAVVGFLLVFAPAQPRHPEPAATKHVTEVQRVVRVVRKPPVEVTRVVSADRSVPRPAAASRTVVSRPGSADRTAVRHTQTAPREQPPSRPAPAQPAPQAGAPAMGEQADLTPVPREQASPKVHAYS
jgi:hypothetical protein